MHTSTCVIRGGREGRGQGECNERMICTQSACAHLYQYMYVRTTTNDITCSIKAKPASAVRQPQSVCVS